MAVVLDGAPPTIDQVVAVARDDVTVTVGANAVAAMQRSAEVVNLLANSSEPAYGVSTGFGSLASVRIAPNAARSCSGR